MVTTLILVGACKCSTLSTFDIHLSTSRHLDLRRDTYEDYTFPLASVSNDTNHLQGFDLHSLRNYAKHHRKSSWTSNASTFVVSLETTFTRERFVAAERELRADANTHYHTTIGWATGFEIIATLLIFIVTAVTFLLGAASRSDDV